jgi:hypothetical protein
VNGRRFEDAENIKKYNRGIVGGTCKWAQKCETSQGDYFEEYWKICSILNVVFLKLYNHRT